MIPLFALLYYRGLVKEKSYSILRIFPYFVLGFIGMIVLRNIGPYHQSRFESLVNANLKLYAFETRPKSKEYLWTSSNSCKYQVINFPISIYPEKDISNKEIDFLCGTVKKDNKKGKSTLLNLMGEKEAYLYANNLKKKILRKLEKHGKKANELISTIKFILERKF